MATEEEKKRNLARITAMIIYGLEKGLWDLFGEGALATVSSVGEGMLEVMEKEMGLEIEGENPQELLTEIARIFVDEIGVASNFAITKQDDTVELKVKNCALHLVEDSLIEAGIQPFLCPFLNIAAAALRRRMGLKTQVAGIEVDTAGKSCLLHFRLL